MVQAIQASSMHQDDLLSQGTATGTATSLRNAILIIDDDADLRDSMAEHIHQEGFDTLAIGSCVEALDMLRGGLRPALILLDLQMAGMTGWEFRAEQKSDPALARIPVIAMTAGYSKWRTADDFTAC